MDRLLTPFSLSQLLSFPLSRSPRIKQFRSTFKSSSSTQWSGTRRRWSLSGCADGSVGNLRHKRNLTSTDSRLRTTGKSLQAIVLGMAGLVLGVLVYALLGLASDSPTGQGFIFAAFVYLLALVRYSGAKYISFYLVRSSATPSLSMKIDDVRTVRHPLRIRRNLLRIGIRQQIRSDLVSRRL